MTKAKNFIVFCLLVELKRVQHRSSNTKAIIVHIYGQMTPSLLPTHSKVNQVDQWLKFIYEQRLKIIVKIKRGFKDVS